MTIKLLAFDFDGVIANTSNIHLSALNFALFKSGEEYMISEEDNIKIFGTISTKQKLEMLSQTRGLPREEHARIISDKNYYTYSIIESMEVTSLANQITIETINKLKEKFKVVITSNTNRKFLTQVLNKIGLEIENIYCNDSVINTKPSPEIYLKALLENNCSPSECLIFEDSLVGQEAAILSEAHLFPIESPSDIIYDDIINHINDIPSKKIKWKSRKINVVMPLAGEGSRFKTKGFETPKPLIDINGLPMFVRVIEDLNIDANFIFLIKKEHDEKYDLEKTLKSMMPECKVVKVSGKQQGAATTILHAKSIIDNDLHLMIVNGDQMWTWHACNFYNHIIFSGIDGSIPVFEDKSRDPKWSFALTDENGYVQEVAEKKPISDLATAGIYYFNKGSDFVKYAEEMVAEECKVNGEYYVCPVYNFMIRDGKIIDTFMIDEFWPTGTPEELEYYLANRKSNV